MSILLSNEQSSRSEVRVKLIRWKTRKAILERLPDKTQKIYFYIERRARRRGYFETTWRKLAAYCGVSLQELRTAVKQLHELVTARGWSGLNRNTSEQHIAEWNGKTRFSVRGFKTLEDDQRDDFRPKRRPRATQGRNDNVVERSSIVHTHANPQPEEASSSTAPAGGAGRRPALSRDEYTAWVEYRDGAFTRLFNLWPKEECRVEAERWWRANIRPGCARADVRAILRHARYYAVTHAHTAKQYIPLLANWLRQQRFKDATPVLDPAAVRFIRGDFESEVDEAALAQARAWLHDEDGAEWDSPGYREVGVAWDTTPPADEEAY